MTRFQAATLHDDAFQGASRRPTATGWWRGIGATLVVMVLCVVAPVPAHAASMVESYVVEAKVDASGLLEVVATIVPDDQPGPLVQRFATALPASGGQMYRFTVDDVAATGPQGADAGAVVRQEGGFTVVEIPDANGPVTLRYTVRGAAIATGDTTTVAWSYLQGLNLAVRSFDATVAGPGPFMMIDCAAGAPAHPGACGWYSGGTHDQRDPSFHDGPRAAGEIVQPVVRYASDVVRPNQQIDRVWSLDRAFSTTLLPLALALGIGVFGLATLWLVHRRFGQDAVHAGETPTAIAAFRSVGEHSEFALEHGVRPGEVGTLLDERVDPVDIAATVLDLAVRGELTIRELPRPTPYARTDWEFVRRVGHGDLHPYETTVLDALAPPGRPVRLSDAGAAVGAVLGTVQSELYDEVVASGWFVQRPDATRNLWTFASRVALAVSALIAVALVIFTPFGLLGLVLVALSLGAGVVGHSMPARTPAGVSVLSGLSVLRGQLLTQDVAAMPPGREVDELSKVLPYAVVLGGAERWLDGLVATDGDDTPDAEELDWYHGPAGWHLADLPDSLRNFITTFEGVLVSR